MDTLTNVLDTLHFGSAFYFSTVYSPPWSIAIPTYKNVARFHYVTQGTCWVRIEGVDQPMLLRDGEMIIVPHGCAHIMSYEADSEPMMLDDVLAAVQYDGGGKLLLGEPDPVASTRLVCGHFEFSQAYSHPLIQNLPPYIVINENNSSEYSWLKDSLRFMEHVATEGQLGSEAILKRLSEIVFIQSIKHWSATHEIDTGFVAALNDKQLSKCLTAFHSHYCGDWSIERMAEQAGMSKSLFSDKFKRFLNISPMQYVAHWRMQNAQRLLLESNHNLEQIANLVGYETVASFSKAFKRVLGISPGEYRRSNV
ncbi:AraC family transcriptional regulator [Porticoccus sp. W117]|uniref:AraC family transcriptional regulator n=1 Tax=Porticoccus sp. W117 TaxID=3054777 RepID=UPI002595AEC0|nr:AraC family transcriptional regulator [Porticoccus sp. W117]MDM3871319.1 AraC family transcriptional regulator [Porticoccus sp. W117]